MSETARARVGRSTTVDLVERLSWRLNRLRCMSVPEIAHRAWRMAAIHAERWSIPGQVPEADLTQLPEPWIKPVMDIDATPYLAAANRFAAGKFDLFALRGVDLGFPPRWNRDPKTGIEAPLSPGKLLNYRDPQRVGDIKYLWEPNRHLHLVTLAQAYALSGERKYFATIQRHLESWFDACPYAKGANWSSALEPAIRLINWSAAWQLLGGAHSPLFVDENGARFRRRWLESIYRHGQFVQGYFSRFSSANNHLIGEAAGLFVAGLTWPHWHRAHAWLAEARRILEREALLQNAADGVNREQSVAYQQFELDLLLLPALAGRANGILFSREYLARIEAMMEYLVSIMDVGGNLPMFGDADDGYVVRLEQGDAFHRGRSLLATGAILFQRGDFKAKAGVLDDKTRWLFGTEAKSRFSAIVACGDGLPVRQAFPGGGYYILGCDFETDREIRLIADAGSLGYEAIAAHGHADALAFTLSVGGHEFLIDPGTYAYHTEGQWRQYFRGTAAHNTVRVDAMDQSQPGGNFMWLKKARAGCSQWQAGPEIDLFEGWHDGYMRLPDPVMHRRRIILDKPALRVAIEDRLRMKGEHDIEIFFHCSEQCQVSPIPGGYAISRENVELRLKLPSAPNATSCIYHGNNNPIAGWVSRRFDAKTASPTIAWRARLSGDILLLSEIQCWSKRTMGDHSVQQSLSSVCRYLASVDSAGGGLANQRLITLQSEVGDEYRRSQPAKGATVPVSKDRCS